MVVWMMTRNEVGGEVGGEVGLLGRYVRDNDVRPAGAAGFYWGQDPWRWNDGVPVAEHRDGAGNSGRSRMEDSQCHKQLLFQILLLPTRVKTVA